ncbi:type I polyketide synthase [Nocardia sp. NPDC052112]|uniref:type I polyketide synthase n=1 Tax=Nocardia sp. NPDC052112 TaxID=3155646 RepID=UPI00341619F3
MAEPDDETDVYAADDPVAVVGIACRFPGSASVSELWDMLLRGTGITARLPDSRRTMDPRTDHVSRGIFLDDADLFDAGFFGSVVADARAVDPQQRLILELGWAAFEDAGIIPEHLRERRVGVFVGAMWDDYAELTRRQGMDRVSVATAPGIQRSLIANRLSHFLGVTGPSLVVDTGQSSSLMATHLAYRSVLSGESELAVAAGVNIVANQENSDIFAEWGGLSPDGRCHTFDERANGFVRGEGVGVVVLRRLSSAVAAGNQIYCVIRGSAVGHGAGADVTAPSVGAQCAVLRSAYRDAGIDPAAVQYVELHGTGTRVGDPIEAESLGTVLGNAAERDSDLVVGSIKAAIGHLEAAAGIAGFIKTALCVRNRRLPGMPDFVEPNADIPLTQLGLEIPREARSWPDSGRALVAGVSSFGMGGSNCHMVLSDRPEPGVPETDDRVSDRIVPWVISARSASALAGQAAQLGAWVGARPELAVGDVGWSLVTTRSLFEHRAVVLGRDRTELSAGLAAVTAGATAAGSSGVGFVFPGQGAQRAGMGQQLYAEYPLFAGAFDEVCRFVDPILGVSLREVTIVGDGFDGMRHSQPALFALEVALFRLLTSWGMRPAVVFGHSMGEIAAAHVAGVLSLADACVLVTARARLMQALPSGGAMAAVQATEDELADLIAGRADDLGIAAVNGPSSVVISGRADAVDAVLDVLRSWGRRVKRLRVSHASHSPLMAPMMDEFRGVVEGLTFTPPRLPMISTVTGALVEPQTLGTAEYWVEHVRRPVRFADAARTAYAAGVESFIELGPDAALSTALSEGLPDSATAVPALRADRDEPTLLLTAVAELFVRGATVAWTAVLGGGTRVPLPTYAFDRQRYWFDDDTERPRHPISSGPATELAALPASERERNVRKLIREATEHILRTELERADAERITFADLGFDSAGSVELRNRLTSALGTRLAAGVLFNYPTIEALTDHVCRELSGADRMRREEPASAGRVRDDDIAIIGMACRYPGSIDSPDALWRLVLDAGDVIAPMPGDRGWPADIHRGGFLVAAADFDAGFFGISPREALVMDPQQRLLLETSWEALEDAGIDPNSLRDSATGVFTGLTAQDYGPRIGQGSERVAGLALTGVTPSVASGRVAYSLGLVGPAVSVDTACSSSLVALHLAVRSLRAGECSLALAGAATVLSTPGMFVEFTRQGGLAADGRCKSFAEAADGTGWSEGVGVLAVERLSDARRNGHRVLAVVRGSAVNQDGASNGLTAPNGPSQQRVIRQALADARVPAAEVDVVEAHGTGTRLGDPIEAEALLATYGQDRVRPLWLGSVKSNIGHAQAAAGMAGVIKMVQALRNGVLPRTLHVDSPSSHIDWSAGAVRLLTEERQWEAEDRPRRAGVSAFGISGTNAHVILEEAPAQENSIIESSPTGSGVVPWVISARSASALAGQLGRLAAWVGERPELAIRDVGWSLVTTRALLDHRAVVLGRDRAELSAGLATVAAGSTALSGVAGSGRLAIAFAGQGSQRVGMGQRLYAEYPVFAAAFDEVCRHLDRLSGTSIRDVVISGDGLDGTGLAQPALFAVEVALFRLVESWGVRPDVLLGHSVGEITAAHVAGVLSLADACVLVAARGRLMQALPSGGAMAAVQATEDEIVELLAGRPDSVGLAAVNGPSSAVVSGAATEVARIGDVLRERGRRVKQLRVGHAFHSPLMVPMLAEFRCVVEGLAFASPRIPIVSTVTGALVEPRTMCTPDYWVEHVRQPVRFAAAAETAHDEGIEVFLELGPDATLTTALAETLPDSVTAVSALRADRDESAHLLAAVAGVFVRGVPVDWRQVLTGGTRIDVPTYAFDRQRYWLDPESGAGSDDDAALYRLESVAVELSDTSAAQQDWVHLGPRDAAIAESVRSFEGLPELTAALESGARVPTVVLTSLPFPATGVVDGVHATVRSATQLVQAWLAEQRLVETRLVFLTCAAAEQDSARFAGSALDGLLRTVQTEHPDRFVRIELDGTTESRDLLPAALESGEPHVILRVGRARVPRLTRADSGAGDPTAWDPDGTVLVTGASGMLGSMTARHLVAAHGVRHLLLLSRRGEHAPGAVQLRSELLASGAESVTFAAGDVADREGLARVLATVPAAHRLRGVVHTAGILDDGVVTGLTAERIDRVLAPKVAGAWLLHELTSQLELTAFVLYSSVSGMLGAGGQGSYAAANSFLDELARYRVESGLPATSLAWGLWGGSGGIADQLRGTDLRRFARSGVLPLSSAQGLRLLDAALALGEPMLAPMRLDIAALSSDGPAALRELVRAEPDAAPGSPSLRARLATLDTGNRHRMVRRLVVAEVAAVLGYDPTAVRDDQAFQDLGLDSLTAVELRNQLTRLTGVQLPTALAYDYPTIADLTTHLLGRLTDAARPVLERIDALESELADLITDDLLRPEAAARLRRMLDICAGSVGFPDAPDYPDLDSATDEELFALVDEVD